MATAKKETAKKTVEKTIKNEVKEITKVPPKTTTKKEVKETKEVEKETTKEKSFEKRPSAGKQIRDLFENIVDKLKDEHLEILTSQEKTKEVLKIRYAFVKEATENKEDRKINGNARYGAKIITIKGKSYWCCNDLYERNIETFKKWCQIQILNFIKIIDIFLKNYIIHKMRIKFIKIKVAINGAIAPDIV